MKKITAERSDVAFYVKIAAVLSATPEAKTKARQIVCSHSLNVMEKATENGPVEAADCGTSEIEENLKFIHEHVIGSVPAFIFPDGSISEGFLDAPTLLARIETAAKNGKKKQ